MYTLIPAVTNLLSIIPLFWYKLDGKTMEKVHAELDKKRSEAAREKEEEEAALKNCTEVESI